MNQGGVESHEKEGMYERLHEVVMSFGSNEHPRRRSIEEATLALIKALKTGDHEMITLYYGEGVTEEGANALVEKVTETYPECDVDVHYGGQPVYYYMVSLE